MESYFILFLTARRYTRSVELAALLALRNRSIRDPSALCRFLAARSPSLCVRRRVQFLEYLSCSLLFNLNFAYIVAFHLEFKW